MTRCDLSSNKLGEIKKKIWTIAKIEHKPVRDYKRRRLIAPVERKQILKKCRSELLLY